MSKNLRIRIFSFVLASVLSFLGTVSSFSLLTFAATYTSWDDVGDDALKLRDAYLKYLDNVGDGDFIGAVVTGGVDLPIAWLTTLKDGVLAISPVDDLFYYLKDGELQYEDNREHRAGGGGGQRRGEAAEISPEVPASFVKQVKDYWSDYYKPHANKQQFIWSYQSRGSTKDSPYGIGSYCPVYMNTSGNWGGKNWDSFYFLVFYTDDTLGTYYSSEYFKVYTTKTDGDVIIHKDRYLLKTNELKSASENKWSNITEYPFIGLVFSTGMPHQNNVEFDVFKKMDDYLGNKNEKYQGNVSYDDMINTNYVKSDIKMYYMLRAVNFTPNVNVNDDWGFICSSEPFTLFGNETGLDYSRLPDDYVITINGDTIYNYPITDPTDGRSTTINNYITNNYIIPGDDSGGSGGSGDTTNNFWNIDFPDFITNITTSVETAITNVFVADQEVINNYNTQLQDTFDEKLPFVNDFQSIFKSLFVDIVEGNFVYADDIQPNYRLPGSKSDSDGPELEFPDKEDKLIYPKWTIDLTFFGKRMKLTILDFSMYAEPLSYVRLIACVFIYAIYFVNLMKYLPTLIGNVMDMSGSVYTSVNPPRKGKGGDL